MRSRPPHRGPADRWRTEQEGEEADGLPAGFTRADTLMSDAFNRVSRPADKAIIQECTMSDNQNSNANQNANADDNQQAGAASFRDRVAGAGQSIREKMQPSKLARFAKGFGKVAGAIAVTGLAVYGGVSAYRKYVPTGA